MAKMPQHQHQQQHQHQHRLFKANSVSCQRCQVLCGDSLNCHRSNTLTDCLAPHFVDRYNSLSLSVRVREKTGLSAPSIRP